MPIDYGGAEMLLGDVFSQVEVDALGPSEPRVPEQVKAAFDTIFQSTTQAYREVLLGCVVARIQDKSIDIRKPYVKQGRDAFNGRTLDERVVNPFFQQKRIPSSGGPYLSAFRRSVRFDRSTRGGLRDKTGYDALLALLTYLESVSDDSRLRTFLRYLLFRFVQLREAALVPLSRLQRISLGQYEVLISGLLSTPSGGRFPVLLIVAAFSAIKEFFRLDWDISYQGINVADTASGAGGDIIITSADRIIMAAEVTERPVDRSRVATTFNTKIAPSGIEDYLFFVKLTGVAQEARQQAHQYFSQGHEVNFVEIKDWIVASLATMGKTGRTIFNRLLIDLLDGDEVPRSLKVGWNEQIARLVSS